ncbi:LamG-like jellyroll fold domain-containing protein [Streptomyces sp. x-19]|uniref:LamG-like jellyroll fold domain-containing protein n=1 Tax=Streptomyces sp. x-19 TaxID=2789280 RepID=UPI00397FC30B
MTVERPASSRLKTYRDRTYLHTTLVRHQGVTIALGMDDSRRIRYSVLDLDTAPPAALAAPQGEDGLGARAELDVYHWSEDPGELLFPRELARAGYAAVGSVALPRVRQGGRAEPGPGEVLRDEDVDGFLSSTARLSAAEPFHAVSDGRHVFVFRQAVGAGHADALFRLTDGGATGVRDHADRLVDAAGQPRAIALDALLCDRFVLADGVLKPALEVRYRRSRHRDRPESVKDSLGTTDMDGNPFYEPTLVLGFAGRIEGGRFTALLLPTTAAGISRWQFFVHNATAERIEAVNVEQGEDGLFNTQGTRFYTSPDPAYRDAVLERTPGTCPFTKKPLVPVEPDTRFAESALTLSQGAYADVATGAEVLKLGAGPYTLEAWLKPAEQAGTVLSTGGGEGENAVGVRLSLDENGALVLAHGPDASVTSSDVTVPVGTYSHVAVVYDGEKAAFLVNRAPAGGGELAAVPGAGPRLLLGAAISADGAAEGFLTGELDEVRIWDRARRAERIVETSDQRLVGDEPGLAAYYRFDEGTGTTAYDQGPHVLHATLHGTAAWTASQAPLADHPGIRRDAFRTPGRTVSGGLSAALHHQQEDGAAGHSGEPRPLKRQARVLLTWTASAGEDADGAGSGGDLVGRVAALDLAVARDGRLAQLPDVVDLPVVGARAQEVDPARQIQLTAEIKQLDTEIPRGKSELALAKKNLDQNGKAIQSTGSSAGYILGAVRGADRWVWNRADPDVPSGEYFVFVDSADFYRYGTPPPHLATGGDQGDQLVLLTGAPDPTDPAHRWILVPDGEGSARLRNVKSGLLLVQSGQDIVVAQGTSDNTPVTMWKTGGLRAGGSKIRLTGGKLVPTTSKATSDKRRALPELVPAAPSTDEGCEQMKKVTEAFQLYELLTTASKTPNFLQTLTQQLTDLCNEREAKQEELGRVTGGTKGCSDKALPMVYLGTDRLGLGWSGALLDFAHVKGAPFINSSGTGQLGLYFRDAEDRFTGLFYDTAVGRSGKRLAATEDTVVHLTARDAGLDLVDVEVKVTADTAGPFDGRCTLTLATTAGETETWRLLPRRADAFADALNGLRTAPAPVGTVAPDAAAEDGSLTLAPPGARRALAAGDLLDVGGTVYALSEAVEKGATGLQLVNPAGEGSTAEALACLEGAVVRRVAYDPSLVTHSRPGSTAAYGSRLVTAALIGVTGSVTDGTAADEGEARPPRWWGDLPGRALSFGKDTQPPSLAAKLLPAARHSDDLTLEAWVRPEPGGATARIVHASCDADSQYTLALGEPTESGGRLLVAGVGERFAASQDAVADDRWTHVAAAFEQSWALRFAGAGYAEVAHADDLNIARDMTLEVFFQADALGSVQGLVGKGRTGDDQGKRVPYQLAVDKDGRLRFTYDNGDAGEKQVHSTDKVTAGEFHRVAVVRKLGDSREEQYADKDITVGGTTSPIKVISSIVVRRWSEFTFYIDGKAAGQAIVEGAPELGHPGPLEIGRVRRGALTEPFSGVISEVRIWNTARQADDIGDNLAITGPGTGTRPQGLVAHWRFEENEGNTTREESGSHPARLHGVTWVKNPDPHGSTFRLYLDGLPTLATALAAADAPAQGAYGSTQFTLGARTDKEGTAEPYLGVLEEVRVWRTARTEEQILDNLFGRLTGDTAELVAYYPFDDASTEPEATRLADHGPRGLRLALPSQADARPQPVASTAPISSDIPEVRPVFATGQPRYVQQVSTTPAVGEYADLQRLPDGSTRGVLKRVHAYVQDGSWQLVTGFKLGNLASEWVGQVQFDPQLIGYVEGAPPVPSENLVATRRPSSLSYLNTTSVEFQQADQVIQSLSSSTERSVDSALSIQAYNEYDTDTLLIAAPLGFGFAKPAVEGGIELRGSTSLEWSNGWGDQTEVTEGTDTTRSTLVGLSGGWESPDKQVDAAGGRRFLPSNTGYALVQSETADVYALRLAHTGAVVAYRMLPNPDIPRDWNLIPFPINPRYTKQGTLDGTIGFTKTGKLLDESYPNASDGGEYSYFKPREAYALKRRITEDQQRRQAYYEGISTDTHAADPTSERARALLSSFMGPVPGPGDKPGGRKEPEAFARRDIVNTYAWSADGGFFAETTQSTDVVTETTTGSYRFNGMASAGLTTGFTVFGIGIGLQLDASLGGSITRTRARGKEATRSFNLNVHVDTPGDMQKYNNDSEPEYNKDGSAKEVDGRVDAYRFMTFYLDSDKANFEDFYGKVVDQQWLSGPDANATALRQARQSEQTPPCWRVLHRVTFVSRKLPKTLPDDAPQLALEKDMRSVDLSSNYELVRRLEPYVDPAAQDLGELSRQVRDALDLHLPELTPHTEQITQFMADYYGIA